MMTDPLRHMGVSVCPAQDREPGRELMCPLLGDESHLESEAGMGSPWRPNETALSLSLAGDKKGLL